MHATNRPRLLAFRGLVVVIAATAIVRGLAYVGPAAPEYTPPGLVVIAHVLPLWAWGLATIAGALLMLGGLLWPRLWSPGIAAYVGIVAVWVIGYLVSDHGRGWLTSANYVPELLLGLLLARIGPPRRARRTDAR